MPTVQDMQVVTGMNKAVVKWKQSACFPSYEFVVYRLEDCSDEEEFTDCLEDAPSPTDPFTFGLGFIFTGQIMAEEKTEQEIMNLEPCIEYVIMARTRTEHGTGDIVSRLFRTRETGSDEEDLAMLGFQPSGSFYPTVTSLRAEPGENTATLFWKQPECFPDYQLQVVNIESCKTGDYETCLAEFYPEIEGRAERNTNYKDFEGLESCTEYIAMARTTGKE